MHDDAVRKKGEEGVMRSGGTRMIQMMKRRRGGGWGLLEEASTVTPPLKTTMSLWRSTACDTLQVDEGYDGYADY